MANYSKYGQAYRIIASQALDYTSTSASTTAFTTETYLVRLCATSPVHYHIFAGSGASSTATSTDPLLGAGVFEIIGVPPGAKLSAVKAAGPGTSADGRLTIAELS